MVLCLYAVSIFSAVIFLGYGTDLRCRISSRTSYDNTFNTYNVTRILTPESTIDLEAYHSYSPLFLS